MAGTSEGSKKAAKTNKERYGEDFYKKIGAQSWDDPDRSRKTGFALLPKEKVAEYGRKGGKKTKEDYQKASDLPQETSVNADTSE